MPLAGGLVRFEDLDVGLVAVELGMGTQKKLHRHLHPLVFGGADVDGAVVVGAAIYVDS